MKKEFENIFENKKFQKQFNDLTQSIEEYLKGKKVELNDLSVNDLVGWYSFPNGDREVYPSDKCPEYLKGIVGGFVKTYFPDVIRCQN